MVAWKVAVGFGNDLVGCCSSGSHSMASQKSEENEDSEGQNSFGKWIHGRPKLVGKNDLAAS